jgi:hypothetical protein
VDPDPEREKSAQKRRKIRSEDQKKIWKLVFSMQSYFGQRTKSKNVKCVKNQLKKKFRFVYTSENFVQILPESGFALDPDPHSSKMLDPNPHIINADPKQRFLHTGTVILMLCRLSVRILWWSWTEWPKVKWLRWWPSIR